MNYEFHKYKILNTIFNIQAAYDHKIISGSENSSNLNVTWC